jgi:hypothetical protein
MGGVVAVTLSAADPPFTPRGALPTPGGGVSYEFAAKGCVGPADLVPPGV